MQTKSGGEPPPKSDDLDGWREAIAAKRLHAFRLEALAAAFQDLGPRDNAVRNALAAHLNDSLTRMLRKRVGFNHPNKGEDIILRVHGQLFEALLRPKSADGQSLRKAFGLLVMYRMKDALAAEKRARRLPDETQAKEHRKFKVPDADEDSDEVTLVDLAAHPDLVPESDPADGDVTAAPEVMRDDLLFEGVRNADEQVQVNRILESITDYKKRLAFQLFMNGVPYKSKRQKVNSIAQALDISEKTARDWIKEVQLLLKDNEEVQQPRKLRVGDKT
jgi:hypothetical protein